MIRYLAEGEKENCRWLWQEAFPEDSEGFLEYYYRWKTADNRILVKENEKGRILSMAHLNPYQVTVKGKLWTLDYIVGVATAQDSRHQGHMRDILGKMFLDMYQAKMPFCYLMPASEAIYLPFGFCFIFDQPSWRIKGELPEGVRRERLNLSENFRREEMDSSHSVQYKKTVTSDNAQAGKVASLYDERVALASWINRWLHGRYEVYAVRDRDYMERLGAEIDCENGRVYGWYDGQGELKALQALWGLEKREQRFLYSMEPDWLEPSDTRGTGFRPAIMARTTNAARLMEVISLREEAPCDEMEVLIRIRDQLIPGNDGLWRWKLNRGGARLIPQPAQPAQEPLFSTEVLDIDVTCLTSWLFGYEELENLFGENGNRPPWWCRFIQPLRGIFLDEIV